MKLNTKDKVLKIAMKVTSEDIRELILTPLDELTAEDMMTILNEIKSEDYMDWYNENVKWSFQYREEEPPITRFNLKEPK